MTDPAPVTGPADVTPVGPPTPPPVPPAKGFNILGLIALILGVFGFILAVIPPAAVAAWLLLLPAFVLSIIGLTRKNQGKATSLTALILSIVGWIIAIIVTVVVAASSVVA